MDPKNASAYDEIHVTTHSFCWTHCQLLRHSCWTGPPAATSDLGKLRQTWLAWILSAILPLKWRQSGWSWLRPRTWWLMDPREECHVLLGHWAPSRSKRNTAFLPKIDKSSCPWSRSPSSIVSKMSISELRIKLPIWSGRQLSTIKRNIKPEKWKKTVLEKMDLRLFLSC